MGCPDKHTLVEGICSSESDCVCCAKEPKEHEDHEGGVCFWNTPPECEALEGKCHKREMGCPDEHTLVEGICSSEFDCVCCAKEPKEHEGHEGGVCFDNTTPECEALDGKCHKREHGCPDYRPAAVEGICSEEFGCVCCAKEAKEHEGHEGDVCFWNTTPECEALNGKCNKRENGCRNGTMEVGENVCSSEHDCICCAKEETEHEHHEGAHCFWNTTPECEALNGHCFPKDKGCTHGKVEVGNGTCSDESCVCCAKPHEGGSAPVQTPVPTSTVAP